MYLPRFDCVCVYATLYRTNNKNSQLSILLFFSYLIHWYLGDIAAAMMYNGATRNDVKWINYAIIDFGLSCSFFALFHQSSPFMNDYGWYIDLLRNEILLFFFFVFVFFRNQLWNYRTFFPLRTQTNVYSEIAWKCCSTFTFVTFIHQQFHLNMIVISKCSSLISSFWNYLMLVLYHIN